MTTTRITSRAALAASLSALLLAACGGDGSSDASNANGAAAPAAPATTNAPETAGNTPGVTPTPPSSSTSIGQISIDKLEFAQTHVVPSGGLSWALPNASARLRLIGGRDALALVAIGQADAAQPVLQAWRNGAKLGALALNPPSALPPTESNGRAYAGDRWSAVVPAAWMVPGVSFSVSAANYTPSVAQAPVFGTDADVQLTILPFYLFGADDANSPPLSATQAPDAATQQEISAKWPTSDVKVRTHPAGRFSLATVVVGPRADRAGAAQPAYAVTALDQQKDGYGVMSAMLTLISSMRTANGDGALNDQYYAPLLALNSSGKFANLGGGLGGVGSGASVGDHRYTGIFIHEQGHAFGLGHAGDEYAKGAYPYAGGSLNGSAWGYDPNRREFLDVLVPATASSHAKCASSHQVDAQGRCYKQDPMQSGAGDQSSGYKFATFSDYNTGRMQAWIESRVLIDPASPSGYSKWDAAAQARAPYTPTTDGKGLYGVNQNLPVRTGVPVHTIIVSFSKAGSAGASYIYPPFTYTGNLIATFDPTSAADRQAITVDKGTYPWYCKGSGCDYTLRVTYADGSRAYRVLQGGFRAWWTPTVDNANAANPLSGSSLRVWAINVPGDQPIGKIELLDTPTVWNGMPANPTVLLSR
ncbi:M66 family metalloprotease [Burkholderia sp. ABCPW 111]|uniref:M66 family metalloprotease n=1 Tax=Burkholderia sp. ABCPW 111 TaxID=1820025 RepID=UPI00053207C5|nr:M66 family metalloprotease [Burkholderia sp. ABCPW 111]KGS02372.1 peptidase M66 family protein [Burkholderia sp. ABCPW 111]